MEVSKAIIPAAGLGTRFLPLSKAVPKELLPVVGEPMVSWVAKEARDSDIGQLILVLSDSKKQIADYFKKNGKLEEILKKRNQKDKSKVLKKADGDFEKVSFSFVSQPSPKGDGDAVLRAKNYIKKQSFGVLFSDDIFESKTPALEQLKKIFITCQKPVVGLKKVSQEKLSSYGVVKVEKIANRLYKIKEIVEKPKNGEALSNLAIAGRYILPPEIFSYLQKTSPNQKGEIILAEALKKMIGDGKMIYGYEIEGNWLECGTMENWMKTNWYLTSKDSKFGPLLKQYLK